VVHRQRRHRLVRGEDAAAAGDQDCGEGEGEPAADDQQQRTGADHRHGGHEDPAAAETADEREPEGSRDEGSRGEGCPVQPRDGPAGALLDAQQGNRRSEGVEEPAEHPDDEVKGPGEGVAV